jgi:transcription antitermination factor NusG
MLNHERAVERSLRRKGFEVYVPVRWERHRWSDRIKDLPVVVFPEYVFCRMKSSDGLPVLKLSGVRSIVNRRGRDPIAIDESEIADVRALIESGRHILSVPYIRVGQKVVIRDGSSELRGQVVRMKDALRVVVSVEAIGCSLAVEVTSDMISPEPSHECHAG